VRETQEAREDNPMSEQEELENQNISKIMREAVSRFKDKAEK